MGGTGHFLVSGGLLGQPCRLVGMQVKSDTTSNDTNISSSAKVCVLMNSAKDFEFRM